MPQRKEKIHHVKHARNADGSLNMHKLVSHTQQALGQLEAKHYTLENETQEDLTDGRTGVKISFERVETNPEVPAHEASVPE